MTKVSQKEAVYQAVLNVGIEQDEETQAFVPTKEQRAQINNILFEGFKSKSIELDPSKSYTDSELKAYVSGLQSNWLRKDKRLNGGVQYVAKNPGSRAGSTDASIKAMRMLLNTKSDPAERKEIQDFIDKRVAEIKPAKQTELTAEQIELLKNAGLEHLVG
jgi:hypothetical protein